MASLGNPLLSNRKFCTNTIFMNQKNLARDIPERETALRNNSGTANEQLCIIVDDIIRTGSAIEETVGLVKELGAQVIGCGTIVRFMTAPETIDGVEVKSLVDFESHLYDPSEDCKDCREGAPEEHVRF